MGEYENKFAEIEFLQQRINDMAEEARLFQLREIYTFMCAYLGQDA